MPRSHILRRFVPEDFQEFQLCDRLLGGIEGSQVHRSWWGARLQRHYVKLAGIRACSDQLESIDR